MSKALFGIAAALALTTSPAWAGDEKPSMKATSHTVASRQGTSTSEGKDKGKGNRATGRVTGSDSGAVESNGSRPFDQERWLREREGLRDGGY